MLESHYLQTVRSGLHESVLIEMDQIEVIYQHGGHPSHCLHPFSNSRPKQQNVSALQQKQKAAAVATATFFCYTLLQI